MSEFEDKLDKILSSPADMEKIMGIAKSLSGSLGSQASSEGSAEGARAAPDLSGIASSLKDIDPKIFRLVTRLVGEYSSGKNDKAALLNAIKPYLREERRVKVDKAADIAKIAKLAKVALAEFTGGEKGV
jgi:hypothetical protein